MLADGGVLNQTDWRSTGDYNSAASTGIWVGTGYSAIATNYAVITATGGGAAHNNVQPRSLMLLPDARREISQAV